MAMAAAKYLGLWGQISGLLKQTEVGPDPVMVTQPVSRAQLVVQVFHAGWKEIAQSVDLLVSYAIPIGG